MLKLKSGSDPCLERKQATCPTGLTETTGWPADGAAEQAAAGAVNSSALQDCLTDSLQRMSSINNTASQLSHWGRASPFLISFFSTSFFSFMNVFFLVPKKKKKKQPAMACPQHRSCRAWWNTCVNRHVPSGLFTQKEVSCFPHWLTEARANGDVLVVIKIKHFLEPL